MVSQRKYFSVIPFLDGIVEKDNIGDIGVLEILIWDRLKFSEKFLSFIAGEQKEQVDSSDLRVMLIAGEGVFIEKFHIINSVFILFAISRSQGMEKVQL